MRPHFLALLFLLFASIALSQDDVSTLSAPISGWTLQWPLATDDRSLLGNDYAHYDYVVDDHHHTGVDIAANTGTSVRAAASGFLYLIQGNDTSATCGGGPGTGCQDHGYGTTIILRHVVNGATYYTQYSHLNAVNSNILSACGPVTTAPHRRSCAAAFVAAGDPIATSGGTCYGLSNCTGAHLHFEVKNFGTLGTSGNDAGKFGYTSFHPDNNGYNDPVVNLHNVTAITPVTVTTISSGINLRVGPGGSGSTSYRVFNSLGNAQQYRAIATAPGTSTPSCSDGWYQLQRLDGAYFPDVNRGGSIPDGWACRSLFTGGGGGTPALSLSVTPVDPQTRDWNQAASFSITVRDQNGSPVSGAQVNVNDGLQSFSTTAGNTDSNGFASYASVVPQGKPNGSYTITFTAIKAGYDNSAAVSRTVTVSHATPSLSIAVSPNGPTTADWGSSVNYSITVTDGVNPVSGATVFISDSLLAFSTSAGPTNGNGSASYTTTVPQNKANGDYSITFRAAKSGYNDSSTITRIVSVNHSPTAIANVQVTLDGQSYGGAFQYSLTGPTPHSGTIVPAQHIVQPGTYNASMGNGPSNTTLTSITPSSTQNVGSGGSITFTFNLVRQRGTVEVQATLDSQPWSGALQFYLEGGTTANGTDVPMTYVQAYAGQYTIQHRGGGPANASLTSITPSSLQHLAGNSTIRFMFNFSSIPPPPTTPRRDFNLDARSDVFWRNLGTTENRVWFMNGTAVSEAASTTVPGGWEARASGDFDNDGRGDLFWWNPGTGETSVWLMNGASYAATARTFTVPGGWEPSGSGDFDANGTDDLFWHNAATGETSIWFMSGLVVANAIRSNPGAAGQSPFTFGDFNADGRDDIFWYGANTGQTAVWLMNGAGTPSVFASITVPIAWRPAGAGDFDRDGRADVFWHNASTGQTSVWFMNGGGPSSTVVAPTVPPPWSPASFGDFDADGDSDILWHQGATGETSIWLMSGASYSTAVRSLTLHPNWKPAAP